ncbi:MAG: diacylglycerol kinase family lipid kinase [Anaerolineae bacterium]|nr:diacylglycerol kinase family lipid kinase [Anaerolineae bacterium]
MPRMKLIVNPASDRGRTAQIGEALQALLQERAAAASEKGQQYGLDWVLTTHPGHATILAQQAAEDGFDIIVAVGGDGTVHEVVNGLMRIEAGKRPALGIIPVGTGNDFVHNLGLTTDRAEAAHRLFSEKTRVVDVGMISDGTGRQEYWDNTVGIGFSGAVNIATRKLTQARGFIVYLIAVLETILLRPPTIPARIRIDDRPASERAVSMISLCNGPREGGGFPVAPNAVMDDGLITCMIMRGMSRLTMLYFVPVVMRAKHLQYKRHFEESTIRRIQIEADRTLAIHIDGEIFGPWEADIRQVEASIIPGAIKVMCG